jgi:hypothetical protein
MPQCDQFAHPIIAWQSQKFPIKSSGQPQTFCPGHALVRYESERPAHWHLLPGEPTHSTQAHSSTALLSYAASMTTSSEPSDQGGVGIAKKKLRAVGPSKYVIRDIVNLPYLGDALPYLG